MKKNLKRPDLISFFLVSLSIFSYQNLIGPTFSTLLTGMWQTWAAIPSFLGIGLGLWLHFSSLKNKISANKLERFATQTLFFSFIFVFFALALILKNSDHKLIELASTINKIHIIENLTTQILIKYLPLILGVVSVPFLLFGVILGSHFSKESSALPAYRLELFGILIGSLLCIWLLEAQSWTLAVKVLVGLSVLGVAFSELSSPKTALRNSLAGFIVFLVFVINGSAWQLQRNLNLVARDFKSRWTVTPLETAWKSFAKVQLLDIEGNLGHRQVISIGDGTGIAKVRSYKEPFNAYELVSVDLATYAKPKKVAVLFAGAGAELIGLHQKLGNEVETWGVEINSKIPEMARNFEGAPFTDFFKKYNSQFVISDNRRFLETTNEKFDALVYSWSGATVANFSGAIIHTTQYSFTQEGLQAALGRLNPNGILIILGGNKLNIIKSLKILENQKALHNLKDKILIFNPTKNPDWKKSWDDFILVYKNQDWTEQEEKEIQSTRLAKLFVSPFLNKLNTNNSVYSQFLQSTDIEGFSKNLWQTEAIYPVNATDDYPFAYRNFPKLEINDVLDIPQKTLGSFHSTSYQPFDALVWTSLIFVLLLVFSFLKKDFSVSTGLVPFLAWAPVSSAALLFFVYKAILFFGNPTTAYLTVQVATQVGSIVGLQLAIKNRCRWRTLSFISAVFIFLSMAFFIREPHSSSYIFNLNILAVSILFFLAVGVVSLMLSYYFISGLLQKTQFTNSFSIFWAFETLLTGVFGLYGVVLIEEQGIQNFALAAVLISCAMILSRRTVS